MIHVGSAWIWMLICWTLIGIKITDIYIHIHVYLDIRVSTYIDIYIYICIDI